MSKAAEGAAETSAKAQDAGEQLKEGRLSHRPGEPNPDNPKELWILCPSGEHESDNGRWLTVIAPLKLKAAGFSKPCRKCAARELSRQRPEAYQGQRKTSDKLLLSGSTLHWKSRDFTCGICGRRHDDGNLARGEKQAGFCAGCKPWADVALRHEHLDRISSERDAVYAKIKRIREALEGDANAVLAGPVMPFWSLIRRFVEEYPAADPQSRGASQSNHVRHLTLHFEDKPIGEINQDAANEFTECFLRGSNRLGPRSPSTARTTLEALRRILRFAKKQGWIEENPFRRGVALGPPVPLYKSDRIMTRDEEGRLHAACVGRFTYLRAALIYMADVPAYLRDFLKLPWADIDFENGLIPGHRGLVEMTPRLRDALHSLWKDSNHQSGTTVISRTVDGCNDDFDKVRSAAGVLKLQLADIRRTGAWRKQLAGRATEQIAADLGMSHLDNVRELLRVNQTTAQQEINAPGFKEFIAAQFAGGSTEDEEKKHGGPRNVKWTPVLRAQLLSQYEELLPKIKRMDETLPDHVREKVKLRGNKPSDVALDYAAELLSVESNEYLRRTVLPEARRERDKI